MKRRVPGLEQMADTLSAGEAQLLAFIRVLDRCPDILFIDEGLSAMDRTMEEIVLQKAEAQLRNTVIFLVSHRLIPSFKPQGVLHIADRRLHSIVQIPNAEVS